ncbi:MAG: hypothetical protein ACR2HC_10240 [Thermoleophilaceae bacterium]
MARQVSVRELRNRTADVVSAVEAGEVVSLTVVTRDVDFGAFMSVEVIRV